MKSAGVEIWKKWEQCKIKVEWMKMRRNRAELVSEIQITLYKKQGEGEEKLCS